MVFIQLPQQLTEEEQMLKKKYEKLKKKKKALQDLKAPKPEPPPIILSLKREGSKADAKEIAKKLLKSGAIKAIEPPKEKEKQSSGFKRSVSLERKRIGADKPSGFQPFQPQPNLSFDGGEEPSPIEIARAAAHRPPEEIARDLALQEKRRDGKAHYVNRDAPSQGNTIYVHGFGIDEALLRQAFEPFGAILSINTEQEKNCGFITYDSIDAANKAIDEMNEAVVQDIKLKVQLARRQPGALPQEGGVRNRESRGGVAALTSGVSYSAAPSASKAGDGPKSSHKDPPTPSKSIPGAKVWTELAASSSIKGQIEKPNEGRSLVSYEDDDFL